MNIIFDLDGTLINSKIRLYRLFQYLAPESQLTYEQYWDFKKNKISNEIILTSKLDFNKEAISIFIEKWMALIESPEYLALDENFSGIHLVLMRLKEKADLHICTARQFRQPVLDQLERLNLLPFFSKILVTEQKNSKENLISANVRGLSAQDWIVGDTGKDIQVGKLLNIKTCAVCSGFISKSNLLNYLPDLVISSVVDFPVGIILK